LLVTPCIFRKLPFSLIWSDRLQSDIIACEVLGGF
jgi:hypothetical protein